MTTEDDFIVIISPAERNLFALDLMNDVHYLLGREISEGTHELIIFIIAK